MQYDQSIRLKDLEHIELFKTPYISSLKNDQRFLWVRYLPYLE